MSTTPEDTLASFKLGETDTIFKLESLEEFSKAELALIAQAKRELYIVTPDLEPERYNDVEFVDVLSAFARRSRYADARILVGDPGVALRWGHKVVNLFKRIPTRLRIRQMHEEDYKPEEAWIAADQIGLLRRHGTDGFKGSLSGKSIPHAKRASENFEAMWERSREIADFRNLDI